MLGLGNGLITIPTSGHFTNGKSLVLDGTGDYVRIEDNAAFRGHNAFSFAAWIKADSKGDYERVIDYSSTSGNEDTKFRLLFNNAVDQAIYAKIELASGSGYSITDSTAFPTGEWVHYVVTYDKDGGTPRLKLYKNGNTTPVATSNAEDSGLSNTVAGPIVIGAQLYGPGNYWDGNIDEVAIWNTALDADAVAAVYNSGKPFDLNSGKGNYDNSSALVGYWRMFDKVAADNDEVLAGTSKGIIHDAHNPGLGPELLTASEPLTSHLTALGLNTAAIEDGAYKVTYGGSVNGFTLKLQDGSGLLSTDLTIGEWYKVTSDWKLVGTSGDKITARVFAGGSWNGLEGLFVEHGNDFVRKTIYFKSSHTTNDNLSVQNNLSTGETVYLKNVSIRKLNGYPGWANADATSSTDTP